MPPSPSPLQGILSDLFPGVTLPEHDYGVLQAAIETSARDKGLQVMPSQVPAYVCVCVCVCVVVLPACRM